MHRPLFLSVYLIITITPTAPPPPVTCNFDCKHGGVCSETGCDCDGTGYSGKSCSGATTAGDIMGKAAVS
jgi:hypothetical protein